MQLQSVESWGLVKAVFCFFDKRVIVHPKQCLRMGLYSLVKACGRKVVMLLRLTAEYFADNHLLGAGVRFRSLPADKLVGHAHEVTVIFFALLAN